MISFASQLSGFTRSAFTIFLFAQRIQEDSVKRDLSPILFLAIIFTICAGALSCGASHNQSQLQTVTVIPSTADAQSYPSGEVPFVATGNYIDPTHTVTPLTTATWTACSTNGGGPTTDVILSQSGTAKCASGAHGSYMINATAVTSSGACPAITPCGVIVGCTATGIAQLTCP